MAIIDIFKEEKKIEAPLAEGFLTEVSFMEETAAPEKEKKSFFSKDALFSSLCVRLFFLVLFFCAVVWFAYTLCKTTVYLIAKFCFWNSSQTLNLKLSKSWLSLKRSFICEISLLLALLSPALGIMIACAYFLMYDKAGVEEVVPSSLREQFKDLFSQSN